MNRQIAPYALLALAFFLVPAISPARLYNVNTGRFQTMDTFQGDQQDPQSLHKYVYVADNPVNNIDPTGHDLESLTVGDALTGFDGFNSNFSFGRLAAAGPVVVNINVDPADKPSTFDLNIVGNMLQSQLSDHVFNNLVAGSVKINMAAGVLGSAGWIGKDKSRYDCQVVWGRGVLPSQDVAFSDRRGHTKVDLTHVDTWFSNLRGNVGSQFWVNVLAHESIWLNAGGNHDPYKFWGQAVPDGDIHSGTVSPFDPFTVSANSRTTLISEFGFKSAE